MQISEAEAKFLHGVHAQYDSDVVYGSIREELAKEGVIFCDQKQQQTISDLFQKYFGKLVPSNDNKYAALNTAV